MNFSLSKIFFQMALIRACSVGGAFGLQIWLVSVFGASAYGNYAFYVTLCSLAVLIAKGGLDSIALKSAAILIHKKSDRVNITYLCVRFVILGVLVTLFCGFVLIIADKIIFVRYNYLQYFDFYLVFLGLIGGVVFQILLAILRGLNRQLAADIFESILRNLLMIMAVFVLVNFDFKVSSQIIFAYAVSFIGCSLVILFLLVDPRKLNFNNIKIFNFDYNFKIHFDFVASGILNYIFFQMDTFILGIYTNSIELGAYNMACNIVRIVIFIPMIYSVAIQSQIAIAFEDKDISKIVKVTVAGLFFSFISSFFCCALLWSQGEVLLSWIDPNFLIAKDSLLILSIAHVLNSLIMIFTSVLMMTNNYNSVIKAQFMGGIASVALYMILIPKYGQIGAALSMFIGLIVVAFAYFINHRKYVGIAYGILLSKIE